MDCSNIGTVVLSVLGAVGAAIAMVKYCIIKPDSEPGIRECMKAEFALRRPPHRPTHPAPPMPAVEPLHRCHYVFYGWGQVIPELTKRFRCYRCDVCGQHAATLGTSWMHPCSAPPAPPEPPPARVIIEGKRPPPPPAPPATRHVWHP